VQALAAVGAASSGQEAPSLEAALLLYREGQLRLPLVDLEPATVHVFEDAVGGIDAARQALEVLQSAGLPVTGRSYGIVPVGGPKAAAMRARHVPIHASVNEAVLAALRSI
jgi:hypothetical protein